jgi:hypothetical protein
MPHFLYGDKKYLEAVEGLEPDVEKHGIFLDVEKVPLLHYSSNEKQSSVSSSPGKFHNFENKRKIYYKWSGSFKRWQYHRINSFASFLFSIL